MRIGMRIKYLYVPRQESAMPSQPYDASAPKKSTNLSINSDLLRQARELKINLSKTLEERLAEVVREERARRWKEENRGAMEAFNRLIEKHGIFNDIRRWL
jgi:antitoxin CcdA